MGIVSDAYLFYGIDLYLPWGDNWLKKLPDDFESYYHNEKEIDSEDLFGLEDYLQSKGCNIHIHYYGTCEERFFILCTTIQTASRWVVAEIDLTQLANQERREDLVKALEILNAPAEIYDKIGWHLASYIDA